MFQSLWSLRNAVLAAILLAMTAGPAFAQRDYRGGYQDARGNYHSGNEDFGYPYNGGYYPAPGYYPTDPVILSSPYYSTPYYGPRYYSSPYAQSYYYTPASTQNDTSATVQVHVPANAQIWFDDAPTQQRGESRSFYTPPLDSGKTYHYTLRARWDDNGKMKEKTQKIEVRAGKQTDVDFARQ